MTATLNVMQLTSEDRDHIWWFYYPQSPSTLMYINLQKPLFKP